MKIYMFSLTHVCKRILRNNITFFHQIFFYFKSFPLMLVLDFKLFKMTKGFSLYIYVCVHRFNCTRNNLAPLQPPISTPSFCLNNPSFSLFPLTLLFKQILVAENKGQLGCCQSGFPLNPPHICMYVYLFVCMYNYYGCMHIFH